jgi:NosR/NirI family nitrous oxide reductase transcriptional regulator
LVTAFTVINLANILASLLSLGAIDFGIVGDSIVMTKAILRLREAKPDEPHTEDGILCHRDKRKLTGNWIKAVVLGFAVLLAGSLGGSCARAMGDEPIMGGETITQYLTPALLEMIFPGAENVGEVGGVPPSAAVYKGGRQVGYLFSTWDVTQSKGFSDQPLVLLVGLDLGGRITGAGIVHHSEPIAILGLNDEEFQRFAQNYKGLDVRTGVDVVIKLSSSVLGQESFSQRATPGTTNSAKIDAVSRATTSSVLMSDAIVRGARIIGRSRGILPSVGTSAARLDVDRFAPAEWPELEAAGAIAHLRVLYRDATDKLGETVAAQGAGGNPVAAPDAVLVDFYVALLTPAGIGVNILGKTWYDQYTAGRGVDDQIMLLAANGAYSFLGDGWEHSDVLDRVEIAQGERTIRLPARQIKTLPFVHAEKPPDLMERALVFFPGRGEFDPTRPFQVNLLVTSGTAAGRRGFASFGLPYHVPDAYVLQAAADSAGGHQPDGARESRAGGQPPAAAAGVDWRDIWRGHPVKIAILVAALATLTVILFLQNFVTRRPRLHRWIRIGFLSWTLVWLGWYAGAQLTVVNVIADIHAVVTDFRWDFVLVDPLIAILSVFTLAGLFLWGRALFCGWLCPFGALQELINMAARKFLIRQIRIPIALHERLIAVKYLLFLGLVATSFFSWDLAMSGAEVEPFKAAIILRFMTEWPMVGYALALTAASVFVERFYCRFMCPLGGGLSIFGRVRMFNWLKRHPECGTRCRICETVCPVGAIKRSGEIDMNECFYCLDCQVTYADDHTCPPMIARRKRRAERAPAMGRTAGLSTRTAPQAERR